MANQKQHKMFLGCIFVIECHLLRDFPLTSVATLLHLTRTCESSSCSSKASPRFAGPPPSPTHILHTHTTKRTQARRRVDAADSMESHYSRLLRRPRSLVRSLARTLSALLSPLLAADSTPTYTYVRTLRSRSLTIASVFGPPENSVRSRLSEGTERAHHYRNILMLRSSSFDSSATTPPTMSSLVETTVAVAASFVVRPPTKPCLKLQPSTRRFSDSAG